MQVDNFINNEGNFHWFTGVIEDINDPLQRGRYRVRCYGYHTDDKVLIPTSALPWAHVMLPITSASMSGVGESATGLLKGSWVVGFFRDGLNAQDPVIMGSVPSKTSTVDYERGFTDPDQRYPSENKLETPDTPVSAQTSVSDEASAEPVYKSGFSYAKKKEQREDSTQKKKSRNSRVATSNGNSWKFPQLDEVMAPVYPKNHVKAYERLDDEDEAAHIVEYDVTPGKERISEMHRTGTYREITPIGDETVYVTGDSYRIVAKGENVYVKGICNLTIDGDCNTLIEGNWDIEVSGNKNERIKGTMTQTVDQSVTEIYKKTQDTTVSENQTNTIGSNLSNIVGANLSNSVTGNLSSTGSGGVSIVSSGSNLTINTDGIISLNPPS